MRPIRLAYPLARMEPGGAELQMIELMGFLTRNGFDVDVVTRAGSGSLDDAVRAAGARIRAIGQPSTADTPARVAYARRAARPLRWIKAARGQYDIVDAWLYPADVEAALSRPLTRTPVVMSARLGRSPRTRFGKASAMVDLMVNRMTDMVVANAEITAADAVSDGVSSERVRIIRGGVRTPPRITQEERRRQRAALGAGDDHLLVGNVGNFRPMKRQDLLVDAFASLVPDYSHLRLVLVGDGDLRPQVEQQVARLGLKRLVVFTGTTTDVRPLYDAFDLFVQASNSEGLPNVLLEASAAGLAIVATAAGGSEEVIHDGQTGLLVPVDDVDRLASAMREAIAHGPLRQRLGASAKALIERDYGMDRFFREYADLYRELLTPKDMPFPRRTGDAL